MANKVSVSMRLDPAIKALGERRAKEERRSFTGHIEWLIARDADQHAAAARVKAEPTRRQAARL